MNVMKNKLYILNSGSPLITDAILNFNSENVKLINPFGRNFLSRSLRQLLIRLSPKLCFYFLELPALKRSGFTGARNEKIVIFDSPYWFKQIHLFLLNISQANLSVWFWNPVKDPAIAKRLNTKGVNICTFDDGDSKNYGWGFHPQFFIGDINTHTSDDKLSLAQDIFYIGKEKKGKGLKRKSNLEGALKLIAQSNLQCLSIIVGGHNSSLASEKNIKIKEIKNNISYTEVLNYVKHSKCILELNASGQSGLTLRAVEALFYGKKLITNNKNIISYSLYDRGNIYIIGYDTRDLVDFMNAPVSDIPDSIKSEYTFSHWINFMKNKND